MTETLRFSLAREVANYVAAQHRMLAGNEEVQSHFAGLGFSAARVKTATATCVRNGWLIRVRKRPSVFRRTEKVARYQLSDLTKESRRVDETATDGPRAEPRWAILMGDMRFEDSPVSLAARPRLMLRYTAPSVRSETGNAAALCTEM